jgi:hypothetical protein
MIGDFRHVRWRLFTVSCGLPVASLWRPVKCRAWTKEVVRMMVAISLIELLGRHTKIFSGLPFVGAELHQPSGSRMPQDMWRNVRESGGNCNVAESFVYVPDGPAIPLNSEPLSLALPPPQVREKPIWQWHRWSSLFRFPLPLRAPVKNASVEINPAFPLGWAQSCGAYGTCPCAAIDRDQDEPRNMTPSVPVGVLAPLLLPETPSGP